MRYEIRPLGAWTDPVTDPRQSAGRFRAAWGDTLALLTYEAEQLGATWVVLGVDVVDGDVRRDGMLRANAKVRFPGVYVWFESRYGPLRYATDAYEKRWPHEMPGWQANVRAIAKALEALRAVDRYGVTRRGEQYQGWAQLGSRPARPTREQAASYLAEHTVAAGVAWTVHMVLADPSGALRVASKAHHPDRGGDHDTFARLTEARDIILGRA